MQHTLFQAWKYLWPRLRTYLPFAVWVGPLLMIILYMEYRDYRRERAFALPSNVDTTMAEIIDLRYSRNHFIYTVQFFVHQQPVEARIHAGQVYQRKHTRLQIRYLKDEPEAVEWIEMR